MEKEKLRQADFVTSIILLAFGIWMLISALRMPMEGTYTGVQITWFIAPGLFPLIISIALLILSLLLLANSIRTGAAKQFLSRIASGKKKIGPSGIRFVAILLALLTFVYFYIPRVDFFLSILLFLMYFISAFYLDDEVILKKAMLTFFVGFFVLFVVFVTGIGRVLNEKFEFATDVIVLLQFIVYVALVFKWTRSSEELKRKFRLTWIVAVVTPLILCPTFRYFLLVPLPHEGGIIEVFHLIYYSIR